MDERINEYLEGLEQLSDDLAGDIFSLECFRAFQAGQIPDLTDYPERAVTNCYSRIQSETIQHLYELDSLSHFMNKYLKKADEESPSA